MPKIFKWAAISFASFFLITAIFFYFRLGFYKDVSLKKMENPLELHLIYKEHRGAYHEINKVISEVEEWAEIEKIDCPQTFGEYFDDPSRIDPDRLKSHGGCIVNAEPKSLPAHISYKYIEPKIYLKAQFEGSPAIGPMKVYPAIQDWLFKNSEQQNGAIIETYTVYGNGMKTEYLVPLKK